MSTTMMFIYLGIIAYLAVMLIVRLTLFRPWCHAVRDDARWLSALWPYSLSVALWMVLGRWLFDYRTRRRQRAERRSCHSCSEGAICPDHTPGVVITTYPERVVLRHASASEVPPTLENH